jgi:hypothetical protein
MACTIVALNGREFNGLALTVKEVQPGQRQFLRALVQQFASGHRRSERQGFRRLSDHRQPSPATSRAYPWAPRVRRPPRPLLEEWE